MARDMAMFHSSGQPGSSPALEVAAPGQGINSATETILMSANLGRGLSRRDQENPLPDQGDVKIAGGRVKALVLNALPQLPFHAVRSAGRGSTFTPLHLEGRRGRPCAFRHQRNVTPLNNFL